MFEKFRDLFRAFDFDARLNDRLAELRTRTPVPVFWLFGKTQSGKTSIIKFLTGANEAEIGQGFRSCTRHARKYSFPAVESSVLEFLDTRGLDEPGYDPAEEIERFHADAHVVIVTAKVMDHAQENVVRSLQRIRADQPSRPVLLALTCLHEAYPQQQHPQPYPFTDAKPVGGPEDLARSLADQQRRFAGLYDTCVPLDLTRPDDGFDEPNYGGERLKDVLLGMLPEAYRQTLMQVELATGELRDLHSQRALPVIVGYSAAAAAAGAFPVPFVDLLIIPGVQSKMVHRLAELYGQPLSAKRFLEIASTLGIGLLARQAVRELAKIIPVGGSIAGAALAGASTYALGRAFCFYYSAVLQGHVPDPQDLRRYYEQQFQRAENEWKKRPPPPEGTT